jgi:hypothetical protein
MFLQELHDMSGTADNIVVTALSERQGQNLQRPTIVITRRVGIHFGLLRWTGRQTSLQVFCSFRRNSFHVPTS